MRSGRGGPFGAVIVKGDSIVGEGGNSVLSTNDPTAHAEVVAIRAAGARMGTFSLAGTALYSSSEPCPMCLAAIYWARIDRVVFATDRSVAAAARFDDSRFYDELSRPPEERRVHVRHLPLPEGAALFDEWTALSGRISY